MALSVVDAHVRERLIWLRQQQEDMTILLSQVSTACLHCEKTLQQVGNATRVHSERSSLSSVRIGDAASPSQDDCRVVLAKQEISCLLETLQKQQHQFTELADHVQLDAGIPVTFTKVGPLRLPRRIGSHATSPFPPFQDNRVHIGPKMEIRVVTLGLDGAGKTTILFKLKQDEFMQPIPTIGKSSERKQRQEQRSSAFL